MSVSSYSNEYPDGLRAIIDLFEQLPESGKRETLITFAENAAHCAPVADETFDLEDIRKDKLCTDTVGIFLNVDSSGGAHFKVSLGDKVQTLTRAMASILCRGLDGVPLQKIIALPADFVTRIIGEELHRQRSQTVYYILSRMKETAAQHPALQM